MSLCDILSENIRRDVRRDRRLCYDDIRRLCKYISSPIINTDECVLWKGYITNHSSRGKGKYVNFYYNGKKVVLHRLLYENYVGDVESDESVRFTCQHKGRCCNVKHLEKVKCHKKPKSSTKRDLDLSMTLSFN